MCFINTAIIIWSLLIFYLEKKKGKSERSWLSSARRIFYWGGNEKNFRPVEDLTLHTRARARAFCTEHAATAADFWSFWETVALKSKQTIQKSQDVRVRVSSVCLLFSPPAGRSVRRREGAAGEEGDAAAFNLRNHLPTTKKLRKPKLSDLLS